LTGPYRIDLGQEEIALSDLEADGESVVLRGYAAYQAPLPTLSETSHLVVEGHEYPELEDALAAGERWRAILEKTLAASLVGADFGDRSAKSVLTDAGAQFYAAQLGQPVKNDEHGRMAFECSPRPRLMWSSLSLRVGRSGEHFLSALERARRDPRGFTAQERVGYNLLGASFAVGEASADARFVMLMMAVETLLEPELRAAPVLAHVEHLISLTEAAELPDSERKSLLGSLRWLRQESISQAGRRLAGTLEGRQYLERSPQRFFRDCYDLRSRLVHGAHPRPPFEQVNAHAGALELFVRDLLAGELAPSA
jgi:hypothetical protein